MIALLLGLAAASELAPYARVDVDHDGLHLAGAGTSVLTPHLYLYTGLTWQDGLDPLTLGAGVGRPHADVGLVTELGALHVLTLVGGGWDGWTDSPLLVGRAHAVVELPPLPLLLEHRSQVELGLGRRVDVEHRSLALWRVSSYPALAAGAHIEVGWTRVDGTVERRLGLAPRLNASVGEARLGLAIGWDLARSQPMGRFTAVMPF